MDVYLFMFSMYMFLSIEDDLFQWKAEQTHFDAECPTQAKPTKLDHFRENDFLIDPTKLIFPFKY